MPLVMAIALASTFWNESGMVNSITESISRGFVTVKVMVRSVSSPTMSETGAKTGATAAGVKAISGAMVPIASDSEEASSMAVVPSARRVLKSGKAVLGPAGGGEEEEGEGERSEHEARE
jgi:hypothetical protein